MAESYVNRNGNSVRPAWRHDELGKRTYNDDQLEMQESIRNAVERNSELLLRLVRIFECVNAQAIPNILRNIEKNTEKRKRKVVK